MMDIRAFARKTRLNGYELQNRAAVRRLAGVHDRINERADLSAMLKHAIHNGHVGVVRAGRDCDCVEFHYEHIRPVRPLMAEYQWMEQEYAEAEGPLSIAFRHPDAVDDGRFDSRDLALEAFEDGHAHVIYT